MVVESVLTSLRASNFKAWPSLDVRLAPITGLFGPNSSGKTSVIQLLLLLKQTVDSSDRALPLDFGDDRSLTSLGTLRDVIHQHDLSRQLSFDLEWLLDQSRTVADPSNPKVPLFSSNRLSFSAQLAAGDKGQANVMKLAYMFDGRTFAMTADQSAKKYQLTSSPRSGFSFIRSRGRAWPLPPPVKSYGFPDEVSAYFQNAAFLSDFVLEFEKLCGKVHYLGPLREYPKRQYTWGGALPQDVGQRGERVVDALLAARSRGLKISLGKGIKSPTLEEYVAAKLRELGLISEFNVREVARGSNIYQVRVRRSRHSAEVLLTDVGFGVSQILPVIVLCFYAPTGSIIVLEQPEIHLHPAVQAGLADVLIDAVKRRGVQFVIESHSEHLLQRLQRRVAEGLDPEQCSLYFSESRNGGSTLTALEVNLYGDIVNWPANFFGDPLGEALARTEAAQNRILA